MDPRRLWVKLPKLNCKMKCWNSCGPIRPNIEEIRIIMQYLKERGREFAPFKNLTDPSTADHMIQMHRDFDSCVACPYLVDKKCSIYEVRPIICRLWGICKSMKCPWGCKPERWLTQKEEIEILSQLPPKIPYDREMGRLLTLYARGRKY